MEEKKPAMNRFLKRGLFWTFITYLLIVTAVLLNNGFDSILPIAIGTCTAAAIAAGVWAIIQFIAVFPD